MKIGLFLMYGVISFVLTLNVSITLFGQVQLSNRMDNSTFFKPKIVGLVPKDWVTALIIGLISGIAAGIGPASAFGGVVCLLVAIGIWIYTVVWSFKEAATPREVLAFVIALAPMYFAGRMGAIASGAFSPALAGVLTKIVQMAFAAGIAIIICGVLLYHHKSKGEMHYIYATVGVLVAALVVWAIILF